MVQLIHSIWTYILSTWSIRNHHLHQDNKTMNYPDYQQAVRTLYETSAQLPPATREAVFRRPLQDMLDLPPAVLRKWLERSSLYIKQQLKAAKTRAKLNTPDIRSFFNPSQRMISIHHKGPCYTVLMWVFFAHISHRVITLKKRVCFLKSYHHC